MGSLSGMNMQERHFSPDACSGKGSQAAINTPCNDWIKLLTEKGRRIVATAQYFTLQALHQLGLTIMLMIIAKQVQNTTLVGEFRPR